MDKKNNQFDQPNGDSVPSQEPLESTSSPANFEDTQDDEPLVAGDGDVTAEEKALLDAAANSDPDYIDEQNLRGARLDDRDEDGELLGEAAADLDVPGAELDDDGEDIGAEDEENNPYSLGDND